MDEQQDREVLLIAFGKIEIELVFVGVFGLAIDICDIPKRLDVFRAPLSGDGKIGGDRRREIERIGIDPGPLLAGDIEAGFEAIGAGLSRRETQIVAVGFRDHLPFVIQQDVGRDREAGDESRLRNGGDAITHVECAEVVDGDEGEAAGIAEPVVGDVDVTVAKGIADLRRRGVPARGCGC